jgi:hypothetical protein
MDMTAIIIIIGNFDFVVIINIFITIIITQML